MAITIRHSTNSALQYNEVDLSDYLISVGASGKKFLTEAPLRRILNATESCAISFIGDDDGLDGYSARYRFYDAEGNVLNEVLLSLSATNIHNSLPISTSVFYQPAGTTRLTVAIITAGNILKNGDFAQGSGNTFTHWTKNGNVTQSTTEGIDGGRCLKLGINNDGTYIYQTANIVDTLVYTIRFKAKLPTMVGGAYVTGASDSVLITSTEWKTYSMDFVAVGTGANDFYFDYSNDADTGFVYLDDIEIFKKVYSLVTEERTFDYDAKCYDNTNEIAWINKLGGQDTFTFTGLPILEKDIQRDNAIEYSIRDNFIAPKPIYQNRSIKSSEIMTLFTRCENEETARWLRSELFDSIATYLRVGNNYFPIQIRGNVEVYNENGFNYQVTAKFNFAFDVNIQTI